ncbi:MAG: hypothetical protein IIC74_11125, partial [Bacteroidetes bacterium]|nr:hypothetical protein [Bacteroidota bacterium]
MSKILNPKLFLILLSLFIILVGNVEAQSDPEINISLTDYQYNQNEPLLGEIKLLFDDEVENNDLKLQIGEN